MLVGIIVGAVLLSVFTLVAPLVTRDGGRWGFRRQVVEVSPNPYRGAPVHGDHEPRRAPVVIPVAAGLNALWGFGTLLLFGPAGCLLFLFAGEAPLFMVGLIPLVMSGFLLGGRLLITPGHLRRGRTDAVSLTVRWSVIHHVAVSALFLASALLPSRLGTTLALPLFPSIPAGVGIVLALLLHRANRRAELRASESDSESARSEPCADGEAAL